MPSINLSPYTTNNSNYALGNIRRTGVGSWTSIRTGTPTTGNVSQTGSTTKNIGVAWTGGGRGSYSLFRNYIWYDVSAYQSVIISSAELTCPTIGGATALALPVIAVDSSTAFSNNSTTTLSLSQFLSTSFVAYSNSTSWTQVTGFQSIPLNSSAIQSGNNFGVGIIDHNHDFQNVQPAGIGFDSSYIGDMSTAAQRSRWTLTLTYTIAGWSAGDMNGVANGDMGEVNGVVIADINEINGV